MFQTLRFIVNVLFKITNIKSSSTCAHYLKEIVSLFNYIKDDNWTIAHVSAKLGFAWAFSIQCPEVLDEINKQTHSTLLTPLHIAILRAHLSTIKEILNHNPKLDLADIDGNTALHYAAISTKDVSTLVLMDQNAKKLFPLRNKSNCTALHLACYCDKSENIKELLRNALPAKYLCIESPSVINDEISYSKNDNETVLSRFLIDELDPQDMKYGGTPVHWAKSREALEKLIAMGFKLNAVNINQETALHVMIRRQRLECILILLCAGVSTEYKALKGETALHYAVRISDLQCVQALVVFDANLNPLNDRNESPRHLAARDRDVEDKTILYVLHSLGASRCRPDTKDCSDGCAKSGSFNGFISRANHSDAIERWYFNFIKENVLKSAIEQKTTKKNKPVRILSCDGGGIKGLITVQMLIELEKRLKYPLQCYFNWFAGTSTGAFIASLLSMDMPLSKIRALYLSIKDKVIQGSKPYDSHKLEAILKQYLGENTVMSDIKHSKLTITATLADRSPAQLYLFRNYPSPHELLGLSIEHDKMFKGAKYTEQKIWEACRASGAAPTYFRAYGPFLDGGLIANNPTTEVLSEFVLYNDIRRSIGKYDEIEELVLVVSMGAGRSPMISRPVVDVGKMLSMNPAEFYKNAVIAKNLVNLLISQTTNTEFHVVRRAQSWCKELGVPYFRFSPPLSEHIVIDETSNDELISALWQTKAYMHANKEYLNLLIKYMENDTQAALRNNEIFVRAKSRADVDVIEALATQFENGV
ncbi:85 kDa calcium-independent phospholipase A2-like protein [Dinothrombium tinctorium]|uniref:phospholipase A2 n=1 Tax=Dinothrombium tinctorium TaxID=1965070 RepID=A0A443RH86_9ACAR|nr:85 kDa calcium-independent phospholipase A2-like protein [Dinothrombium tinctorium]RWS14653.1 85 kDa calcium-independent phospholipase A2-like protein [Dinothrombium tinctorium]